MGEQRIMAEARRVHWTDEERDDLNDLFHRVTKGKETIGLETGLPRLCALLNYDLTYSTLERSLKLYQSRLDFPGFLLWWACRPESGKTKGSRAPVWRWGEDPRGTTPNGGGVTSNWFF
eukprot:NODE_2191_length_820_cov_796.169909_g1533_i0.p3 GENE.NODE_2191_length_820_cov_796.169909_g1533_i0~~NODE_2191_length_820_cov_796.169909_g1533_i0.p3  ORF type:complete len:126 (+),score=44.42 NODE_2191_length_820_cov_796.169909_g1533_i0:24-380(+)